MASWHYQFQHYHHKDDKAIRRTSLSGGWGKFEFIFFFQVKIQKGENFIFNLNKTKLNNEKVI